SPSGEAGALKSALDYRSKLVERYVDTVREKIVAFNVDLAEKMAIELNKRKEALLKAERELAETGLPRTYNPEHQEMLINMRNLLESLGRHMTNTADHGRKPREVRCFIVHGHDHQSLYELKDYIQNTLELGAPTILRNMPGLGKTLIEQFEVDAPAQRPSRVALGS
ncbi:MAG TPA: hypothetical protein VFE33_34220, partial [Thermoanaerobaculia bacterium]|nr:hypothetical protein [Thermoanaerobaculia bacterium]